MKKIGIRNCEFAFKCSEDWGQMEDVTENFQGETEVRYCDSCKKEVYLCDDDEEFARHIRLNHCIAITPIGDIPFEKIDFMRKTLGVMKFPKD